MTLPRCDIVVLFDCQDGNPNGDPDAGNMPRVDPETLHGLVSDVCQKRKVRDWVYLSQRNDDGSLKAGFDIFFGHSGIPDRRVLNDQIEAAHKKAGESLTVQDAQKATKKDGDKKQIAAKAARQELCATRFDIRTFGAVLSTGDFSAGQVRGPVQCTFARSIDPILDLEICITRKAVTTAEDAEKQMKGDGEITGTMGRKHIIPYGLYSSHWFVSPQLAKDTGFSAQDLKVLCDALLSMFETDRSASRGMMCTRDVIVFRHDSPLGNARAQTLFERVKMDRKKDAPRGFADYTVTVDESNLPSGVQVFRLADEARKQAFFKSLDGIAP
jgi:CRISPR-associated protein Csd2